MPLGDKYIFSAFRISPSHHPVSSGPPHKSYCPLPRCTYLFWHLQNSTVLCSVDTSTQHCGISDMLESLHEGDVQPVLRNELVLLK